MRYYLKNFYKWAGSIFPVWVYCVNLHIGNEATPIPCNGKSIEELVKQIHEDLEKKMMSRSDFDAEFLCSSRRCESSQIGAKRYRAFSDEDEDLFLKLLTDQPE